MKWGFQFFRFTLNLYFFVSKLATHRIRFGLQKNFNHGKSQTLDDAAPKLEEKCAKRWLS